MTSPRGAFDSASVTAWCSDVGDVRVLDLQPHRTHELEHLDDDGVGQLGFADDVGQQRLRVDRVGHLTAQQPRHDLDAGQRVLELVRDAGRHLAERRQAIAQALALLHLLDLGQVLEEHARRRSGRPSRP